MTNREFAAFVNAGGYTRRGVLDSIPSRTARARCRFDEAMARFKDSTGRPGPATWKLGSFPDGEEELPVAGLSWYEAAAYAAFAGKELPTVYHWYQADTANDIQLLPGLVLSTHQPRWQRAAAGRRRPARSAPTAPSTWPATSASGRQTRATDRRASRSAARGRIPPTSICFPTPDRRSIARPGTACAAMKRLEARGRARRRRRTRRCLAAGPSIAAREQPVSDAEYAVFTRFFERRPVPLEPRVESTDDSSPHWIKQRVSFAAGYGTERMTALLYLPRGARPPYQVDDLRWAAPPRSTGNRARPRRTSSGGATAEYLIRGGRAVMIPIWKGSYERSDGFHPLQTEWPPIAST